uniref:F-box domain-containing protein n=1 Tax=Aegilops tauschii TaxID=37682 RepID=N1QSW7_AEGTA
MPATLRPSSHQWADLLPELLGRVIDRLPRPDDRARFRAVCRPWHLAVRQHNRPQLPWIIYLDGTFVTFPDHGVCLDGVLLCGGKVVVVPWWLCA